MNAALPLITPLLPIGFSVFTYILTKMNLTNPIKGQLISKANLKVFI